MKRVFLLTFILPLCVICFAQKTTASLVETDALDKQINPTMNDFHNACDAKELYWPNEFKGRAILLYNNWWELRNNEVNKLNGVLDQKWKEEKYKGYDQAKKRNIQFTEAFNLYYLDDWILKFIKRCIQEVNSSVELNSSFMDEMISSMPQEYQNQFTVYNNLKDVIHTLNQLNSIRDEATYFWDFMECANNEKYIDSPSNSQMIGWDGNIIQNKFAPCDNLKRKYNHKMDSRTYSIYKDGIWKPFCYLNVDPNYIQQIGENYEDLIPKILDGYINYQSDAMSINLINIIKKDLFFKKSDFSSKYWSFWEGENKVIRTNDGDVDYYKVYKNTSLINSAKENSKDIDLFYNWIFNMRSQEREKNLVKLDKVLYNIFHTKKNILTYDLNSNEVSMTVSSSNPKLAKSIESYFNLYRSKYCKDYLDLLKFDLMYNEEDLKQSENLAKLAPFCEAFFSDNNVEKLKEELSKIDAELFSQAGLQL